MNAHCGSDNQTRPSPSGSPHHVGSAFLRQAYPFQGGGQRKTSRLQHELISKTHVVRFAQPRFPPLSLGGCENLSVKCSAAAPAGEAAAFMVWQRVGHMGSGWGVSKTPTAKPHMTHLTHPGLSSAPTPASATPTASNPRPSRPASAPSPLRSRSRFGRLKALGKAEGVRGGVEFYPSALEKGIRSAQALLLAPLGSDDHAGLPADLRGVFHCAGRAPSPGAYFPLIHLRPETRCLDGNSTARGLHRLRFPRRPPAPPAHLQRPRARQPGTPTPHPRRRHLSQRSLPPAPRLRPPRGNFRPMGVLQYLPRHEPIPPTLRLILATFTEIHLRRRFSSLVTKLRLHRAGLPGKLCFVAGEDDGESPAGARAIPHPPAHPTEWPDNSTQRSLGFQPVRPAGFHPAEPTECGTDSDLFQRMR